MQYKEHCISNLGIGTLLSIGLGELQLSLNLRLIFAFSFILATFFLSPDLDLFHSAPSRNWGCFKILWWPYTKLFKHRGISHVPILGTGSRFIYLSTLAYLGVLVYDVVTGLHAGSTIEGSEVFNFGLTKANESMDFFSQNHDLCVSALAGAAASDLGHLFVDGFSSLWKRIF